MLIKLNTLSEMPIAIDKYGEKVSILLNLGNHLRSQPFAVIEKKLFGGRGEIFTSDRFIEFKSNGGFSKLKKQETVNYSEITQFVPSNSSYSLSWGFQGSTGEFNIGLVFYGKVKGFIPRDIFWYEVDDFPKRSGEFYKLIAQVLPRTGITSNLRASTVKHKLEEAIDIFEGNIHFGDTDLHITGENAKYPGFTALQYAFSSYLAGTAIATDTTAEDYLDIFRSLDNIYVRILKKLMTEYNGKLGNMFNREQKIYEADEKFQRLSSLWYLRQMVNLHFASAYLPEEETKAWPMKVLKPRARTVYSNKTRKVTIKLPEPEIYEEAIAAFDR